MRTRLIAHRGQTAQYPENTLSAFLAARAAGADAIELDVHMTVDGVLVVHHDYYLGDPDDGHGLIFQKDIEYIKGLKIGDDEAIPKLEEVFERIGDTMLYELELKGFTEPFLQQIVSVVERYGLMDTIEFTSPHPYNLSRLKERRPTVKTGLFVNAPPDWMDAELSHVLAVQSALAGNLNVLHCALGMIDEQLLAQAHAVQLEVHAADCNTMESLEAARRLGVDQLSTDELELALQVFRSD